MDANRGNAGYAAFRAALLDGRIAFGSTLTQQDICAILRMSLSPLRETLLLLEADGIVTIRRRSGVQVVYPDIHFVSSNFQFRSLIEREAVARFADVVTDEWLAEITGRHIAAIEAIRPTRHGAESQHRVKQIEMDLHGAFVAALKNDLIAETHLRISENLNLLRVVRTKSVSAAAAIAALNEHLAILEPLRQRDAPGAVAALDHHLKSVIHRIFSE
jgi:DNA-binding GntR family transcriptional regulator